MSAIAAVPENALTRLFWVQQWYEAAEQHPDWCWFVDSERMTGKSHGGREVATAHHLAYGPRARTIVIRSVLSELQEYASDLYAYLCAIFGPNSVVQNKHDQTISVKGHGSFLLTGVASKDDAVRLLGRSFSQMVIEEATTVDPEVVRTIRTSLRIANVTGQPKIPTRIIMTTNAWGKAASHLKQRYVTGKTPGVPFLEDPSDPNSRTWVRLCPSITDNPYVDLRTFADLRDEPDKARRLAYLVGGDAGWNMIGSGSFMDGVNLDRCIVPEWPQCSVNPNEWELSAGYDHGHASPFSFLLMAKKIGGSGPDPLGWTFPLNSIVIVAEAHNGSPHDLDKADPPMSVEQIAISIKALCDRYGVKPRGIADSAIFAQHGSFHGDLATEFRRCGVYFSPSSKPRLETRGPLVKTWLSRARKHEGDRQGNPPGLYISRGCTNLLDTLRSLERHPNNPDVHAGEPCHAYDALTYRLMTGTSRVGVVPLFE